MAETYNIKYQFNIHPDAKPTIINEPQFNAPVTFNNGETKKLPPSQQKVKEAIETLSKEGVLTQQNQWWAIFRVLSDMHGYDKNKQTFSVTMENMGIETKVKCDYNKWRNTVCPHLSASVETWKLKAEMLSEPEKRQLLVANRLIELLQQEENAVE